MKTIFLTQTFQQARIHARELDVHPRDIVFPGTDAHALMGFNGKDVQVVVCPTFYRRLDSEYIKERVQMLDIPDEHWRYVD